MATELAAAYVQIIPSAKGIKGSLTNVLSGEANSAGTSTGTAIGGKIKSALLAAGIGTAVAAVFKAAIQEGSALQQSIGGIETLFGKSADVVKKNAANAYKTTGLSANAYMEQTTSFAASLLQSVSGNTKKAANSADMAMQDMSDNSNKMGTNMQDIQNAYQGFAKQNYTMLDNLKLGYGGTKTEMQRLLTDATKLTGQKYDITNLNDVYSAIHAIQGDLGITGTTAREAATTFTGSFSAMKAAAQNLLGNLATGADIGPSLQALGETASTFIFNNLIPMLGNIIVQIPGMLGSFVQVALSTLTTQMNSLFETLLQADVSSLADKISGWFSGNSGKILDTVWSFIKSLLRLVSLLAAQLIVLAGELIGRLAKYAFGKLKAMGANMIKSIWDGIKSAASGLLAKIRAIVDKIKNLFKFKWELPKIKLPHFKLSGKFSLKNMTVPHLSVDWYKGGGIFNSPSVIGVGDSVGPEAVVPIDKLQNYIREANQSSTVIIDYDKLADAVLSGIEGMAVELDKRKLGKIVRKGAVGAI